MKKLNNKGITTIEVIISFVLVVIISASLFTTITAYNAKRLTESYKSQIYTYKNQLTKTIQDDLIKKGLVEVTYNKYTSASDTSYSVLTEDKSSNNKMIIYQLDCTLKDGTNRRLVIYQRFTKSKSHPSGSTTKDDYFMIEYGTPDLTKDKADDQNANLIEYPIPDVGTTEEQENNGPIRHAKDLSINNILVSFGYDSSYRTTTNILSLYIGFYHPELSTRYGINIISPINFTSSSDGTTGFDDSDTASDTQYRIDYNTNGGEEPIASEVATYNDEIKLPSDSTKPGYELVGFSTDKDSTTAEYAAGSTVKNITTDDSVTLYAIWKPTSYTFDSNENVNKITIDTSGTYNLEVWGAQGGGKNQSELKNNHGGPGGYASTTVYLEKGTNLYVTVGKSGTYTKEKVDDSLFKGAGKNKTKNAVGTGGGATYISNSSSEYTLQSMQNIYLIAAGGGGAGCSNQNLNSSGGAARSVEYVDDELNKTTTNGVKYQSKTSKNNVKGKTPKKNKKNYFGSGGSGYLGGNIGKNLKNSSFQCSGASGGISKIFVGDNQKYTEYQEAKQTATSNYYKLGDGYAKITLIS